MIVLDPSLEPDRASRVSAGRKPPAQLKTAQPVKIEPPLKATLTRFTRKAQSLVKLRGEVNILLTSESVIRKLNREFRGKDKATDVLSFPAEGPAALGIAGDLAISVPAAKRQAEMQGHSLPTELKVLLLHGLLHLAGYDHETDAGQMERRERQLRKILGLPLGLIERTVKPKSANSPRRRLV